MTYLIFSNFRKSWDGQIGRKDPLNFRRNRLLKGRIQSKGYHGNSNLRSKILDLLEGDDNTLGKRFNALIHDDKFRKELHALLFKEDFQRQFDQLKQNEKLEVLFDLFKLQDSSRLFDLLISTNFENPFETKTFDADTEKQNDQTSTDDDFETGNKEGSSNFLDITEEGDNFLNKRKPKSIRDVLRKVNSQIDVEMPHLMNNVLCGKPSLKQKRKYRKLLKFMKKLKKYSPYILAYSVLIGSLLQIITISLLNMNTLMYIILSVIFYNLLIFVGIYYVHKFLKVIYMKRKAKNLKANQKYIKY
ncbi:Plasmodium exported protein, unknown function [Plasmodium malariae]|uniref:Pv-fam-d protein n=1 Tax=Plasmodium malariae TaxID=5858 RepID=A0A1C3KC89_PLAMA|nr:Plasmodium exported protein, unknown function [Plasmodium malariae]